MKEEGVSGRAPPASLVDLHIPRNTPVGVFLAFFAVIAGFALIWRINWLAVVGIVSAVVVVLREYWKTERERTVPAEEVAAFERAHGALPEVGHDRSEVHVTSGVQS
jgi:cytochrome o ubiquinol oxidase subunit 1